VSAIVALDGPDGGSVSVPSQVLADGEAVEIGTRVDATIRRIYTQEGVTRYGFKLRPVERRR
jgi:hydroxymethylglutaryl-CoA synthase